MERIIGPAASGKTTRALQKLADQGGGVFITSDTREVMAIARNVGLSDSKIKIVQFPVGTKIIIDGDNEFDVTLTQRTRD